MVANRNHPTLSASTAAEATPIDFIESTEFAELEYSNAELAIVQELLGELGGGSDSASPDAPLGGMMGRSLPPLTAEEEHVLFRRMNYARFEAEAIRSTFTSQRRTKKKLKRIQELLDEADQICRRIVESNIRLVVSIARKYSTSAQQFQEFVSDGLLILLGAIRKFDYSRGFRFSTYATHSVQRHYFRLSDRTRKYTQRFVLTPGEVMAEIAGESDDEVEVQSDPAVTYRRLMQAAEGRLTEREEVILERRFGTGEHGMTQTLREIASDLGISKERVRQIQIAALAKLRDVATETNLAALIT